ncbi:MAG: aromatic ring-hydroxylating dioxygenase subunit alpha, partial [Rugosibacter sp.]|nr:aromatic ring-hydroxylating dioxygenase subunit alpha [Rugosibacter sp.]
GNTRSFVCSYHGWAYGIDGSLQGVPLEKEVYSNQLDKSTHGLVEVALVDSFCGFVYGCFDPAAPSLREFMGEAAWYLEAWMGAPGGTELIGPPSRSILNCNWKTPGENFIGDMYHVGWTHASSTQVLFSQSPLMALQGNASLPAPAEVMGMHYTSRSGHGAAITYGGRGGLYTTAHENEMLAQWLAQQTPKVAERLGAVRAKLYNSAWDGTIFPNNSFLVGPNTFKVWLPRGPGSIEALTWTWVEKDMPTELKRVIARNMNQTFGTAGMLESEDADNMESMTQSNDGLVTRRGTLNAQMGMGKEREDAEMPGVVSDAMINELSHRGFYRYYQEMLVAESWDELRANSSRWKAAHLER